MSLTVGTLIEQRYEIVRVLGEGGLGQVLLARHVRLDSFVALKVLRSYVAKDADVVARFEREARACAQIRSDHVVHVIDVGRLPEGAPYLVMEYLEGENLDVRIRRCGPLDVRELATRAIELLDGLGAVHAAGVLHRDVKPANVFLARSNHASASTKLVDFGLAKPVDGRRASTALTLPGIVMGTPAYMSPEQIRDLPLDARSDLFAVGVVLYEAATGKLPFRGETPTEVMASILNDEPIALAQRAPLLDPMLARIVHRALARNPGDRYASAAEMRDVLSAWKTLAFADEAASESVRRLSNGGFRREPPITRVTLAQASTEDAAQTFVRAKRDRANLA